MASASIYSKQNFSNVINLAKCSFPNAQIGFLTEHGSTGPRRGTLPYEFSANITDVSKEKLQEIITFISDNAPKDSLRIEYGDN